MARLEDIVFDRRHAASLARFWAERLDGYAVAPYDGWLTLQDPEGNEFCLFEASGSG